MSYGNSITTLSLSYLFSIWLSHSTKHDILFNSVRPRRNRRHFADDIFKCIFLKENVWIPLKLSLKFVPNVRITKFPALVQIMAWRISGVKPLSEPMMVNLLTHICDTRSQWVNSRLFLVESFIMVASMVTNPLQPLCRSINSPLLQANVCPLFDATPLHDEFY